MRARCSCAWMRRWMNSNAGSRRTKGEAMTVIMRLLLGVCTVLSAALCHAQYPARPITLLVPWAPGGGTDIALRALADGASKHLGQRIIVENKPGAGGALAAQQMAASA